MKQGRTLERELRRWTWVGAAVLAAATTACIGLLLVVWSRQIRDVDREMEAYARGEALAVARLVLYDLASDPRMRRVQDIEDNLLRSGVRRGTPPASAPSPELEAMVRSHIELPDSRIWGSARAGGWRGDLREVTEARRYVYESALADILASLNEDLSARVTFSDHLRGLDLMSTAGLARVHVGDEPMPEPAREGAQPLTAPVGPNRLLATLPLYVDARRWGTARFLMDRSPLNRATDHMVATLDLSRWVLVGLLLSAAAVWAGWSWLLTGALRRRVVDPVASLARRMDAYRSEAGPSEDVLDEPTRLAEIFERLTDRVGRQEDQLLRAQRLGLMERMGAGLSHELNNALNPAVLRLDEMALEKRPPRPEDVAAIRQYLASAQRTLKVLSLIGRGGAETPVPLRKEDWLDPAAKMVEGQYRSRSVALHWEVPASAPEVLGGEQALTQVVLNVLLNALDAAAATRNEGGRGNVWVSLSPGGDGMAHLQVEDDGPGIPEDHRGRLFEPFFTTKAQGTGLGLYMVDAFLRRMGGAIEVAGRPAGEGTRVTIRLPVPGGSHGRS